MERRFRAFSKSENKMFYDVLVDSTGWRTRDNSYSGKKHIMQRIKVGDNIEDDIYELDIFNYVEKTKLYIVDMNLYFRVEDNYKVSSVIISTKNECWAQPGDLVSSYYWRYSVTHQDYYSMFLQSTHKSKFKKIGNVFENGELMSEFRKVPKWTAEEYYNNMFGITTDMVKAYQEFYGRI
jgi:hypothetical protein